VSDLLPAIADRLAWLGPDLNPAMSDIADVIEETNR
jgi:hypothetical protein